VPFALGTLAIAAALATHRYFATRRLLGSRRYVANRSLSELMHHVSRIPTSAARARSDFVGA
jgi:hypothetical protein